MKVSICIPHYEQPEFLMKAVRSAVQQSSEKFEIEIVICDNASSPAAKKAIEQVGSQNPQIRIFQNEYNIGMVANWNRVVAHSTGDIVCLLSADDELLPNAVSAVVAEFEADHALDLVYGPSQVVSEKDVSLRLGLSSRSAEQPSYQRKLFRISEFSESNRQKPEVQLASAFFSRRVFELIGGFKGEAGTQADWLFWSEIGQVGCVLRIETPLGVYRVHDRSETFRSVQSFRWIISHYLADESIARFVVREKYLSFPSSEHSHALDMSIASVLNCLQTPGKRMAVRQSLLIFLLWPSLRTIKFLWISTVASHTPTGLLRFVKTLRNRARDNSAASGVG